MTFEVRFAVEAEDDLIRLFEFLLERAKTSEDLEHAGGVINALRVAVMSQLSITPFSFRKAGKRDTA